MMPKVSVLMLAYNQARYIDEAIRGVVLQRTTFSIELVISDDASSDDTARKCREWQTKYPDIIRLYERKNNLGLQQNFIQSYNECRGEYIAICEGDDYWCDATKLQRQVGFLDTHSNFSTCFHRVVNYYESDHTKSLSNGGQRIDTTVIDLAHSNYISNVSAVFRRGLFGELPEWFARVSTYDLAIHILNAMHGDIHYMTRPMAVYRQRSEAIWSRAGEDKKLKIAMTVRELLMQYVTEHNRNDVYKALLVSYNPILIRLIQYYRAEGNNEEEKIYIEKYMQVNKNADIADINRLCATANYTISPLKKVIKRCRAIVSLMIPLPRIK